MPAKQIKEEIPWDEIEEVMKNHSEVTLRIQRRNGKGHLQTLAANVKMESTKLPNLEDWLQAFAGGGQYEIEVKDPNGSQRLIPRFRARLEGAMRPARFLGSLEDQYAEHADPYGQVEAPVARPSATQQRMTTGFQPPPGPWVQGLHPTDQRAYARSAARPAPGATVASDQLAMQQFAEHKAETAKQMAKLESQVERLLADNKRKDEALAAERERAREERHKSELQRIEERLAMMMQQKPKEETSSPAKIAEALAPFAPVFAAMVTSRESSASKSLEVQQQGLAALMNATLTQANKPDSTSELLKTVGPLVIPFIKDIMEQKSPEKQALLYNAMAENSLSSLAMMAQLIESFASQGSDPDPWWLGPVKEALGGVVGMTEAYMMSKGGLPGQAPAQLGPGGRPTPPQGQKAPQYAGTSYKTEDADEHPVAEVVDAPAPNPARARNRADRAMQYASTGVKPGNGVEDTLSQGERTLLSFLPQDFQTPEWRAIAIALQRQEDPEDVADLCASHIVHLINFNLLPSALEDVTDDPARALDRLLTPLPIMQHNPDYGIAVMQKTIELLIEAEAVVVAEPIAEEVDEQSAVEEVEDEQVYGTTPAPPAAQQAS